MNTYWKPADFDRMLFEDNIQDVLEIANQQSADTLIEINKSLEGYSPEETSTIMDFLCKDESFKRITSGDPNKLSSLAASMEVSTAAAAAVTIGSGGILIGTVAQTWALWKWADQKTVKGVAAWAKEHNANTIPEEIFEKKAKVPNIKDFEKMSDAITKALPLLDKLVSGQEVNDAQLEAAVKTMGFQIDMSRFDNYSGHFYAFLVSAIKGIGIDIAAFLMVVLVGALTAGILAIPAAIYATIWSGIKHSVAYKQAYEKWQADSSMMEKGWNRQTFMRAMQNFQLHYRAVMGYATKLDKLHGGEVYTRSEAAHAHLFADVILLEIKTEARILGTVISMMDKLLSIGLKG